MRSMLIIVIGLPGTGKTTFSRALANRIGAYHLNTDIIRDAVGMRGQYDSESKKRIYDLMLLEASRAIHQKKVVILDGTFYKESMRIPYRQLAFAERIPLKWIELRASEEVIQERTSKSRKFSEADFNVYQQVRDAFAPFNDDRLTLQSDSSDRIEQMLEEAVAYVQGKGT